MCSAAAAAAAASEAKLCMLCKRSFALDSGEAPALLPKQSRLFVWGCAEDSCGHSARRGIARLANGSSPQTHRHSHSLSGEKLPGYSQQFGRRSSEEVFFNAAFGRTWKLEKLIPFLYQLSSSSSCLGDLFHFSISFQQSYPFPLTFYINHSGPPNGVLSSLSPD